NVCVSFVDPVKSSEPSPKTQCSVRLSLSASLTAAVNVTACPESTWPDGGLNDSISGAWLPLTGSPPVIESIHAVAISTRVLYDRSPNPALLLRPPDVTDASCSTPLT